VRLRDVENPLLIVIKHAHLHWMEVIGLWEVAHDTGNMSKHIESLVIMARQEFSFSCLSVGIAECSILVAIPLGALLVRRNIITKFVR
jgi:hypothetical protein